MVKLSKKQEEALNQDTRKIREMSTKRYKQVIQALVDNIETYDSCFVKEVGEVIKKVGIENYEKYYFCRDIVMWYKFLNEKHQGELFKMGLLLDKLFK